MVKVKGERTIHGCTDVDNSHSSKEGSRSKKNLSTLRRGRRKKCPNLKLGDIVHAQTESPGPSSLVHSDDEEEILQTDSEENPRLISNGKHGEPACNVSTRKRPEFSLSEKLQVIEYAEKFSERETASAFGISKTAVNYLKRIKPELMALHKANKADGARCRRFRRTKAELVNNKTLKWFLQRLKKKEPVTNKELQKQALLYARMARIADFNASRGWLESFKKRFGITLARSVSTVKNARSLGAILEARKDESSKQLLGVEKPVLRTSYTLNHDLYEDS